MSFNKNSHILRKTNTQKDLLYYRNDKKKTKIKKKSVFKINSTIQEGRKDIYISDSIKEQISLTYDLILKNRKELNSLKEDKKILNPSQDEESFKYYLNYFYNYLLLFCLLYKIGDMKNARSTLNHLNSEIKHQLKFADFSLFKLQKYNSLVISYIKFLSSYLACLYKLSTDFNFQEILIKYIEIIEAIPENKIILSYLYFFCGRFLVEINYLGLGIKSYELANANANEYASRLQAYKFVVSILYNKSILEYVFYDEKNKNADLCIETLLDAKNTKLKEIEFFSPKNARTSHRSSISQFRRNSIKIVGETQIKKDKQLLDIYMLLLEFDYKNKNLEAIEDYITFIEANTRYLDKDMIIKAKFILNKINKLHEGRSLLYKSSHRGYNILNQDSKSINEITKSDKYLNNNYINNNKYQNEIKDEDFINYCLPQRKRPQLNQNEIIEFEKFFIFLTKLSAYQIELLNMDQPDKKNFKKFKSLPIYFSNNFKQSLNLEQMNMLNNIKILMLKRKLVLKNVEHLILVDNLNFDLIYKYEECSVPITQLNNLENINKKKEEFQNFNNELIKASQLRKEKKSAKTELNDENNQYKFKYQNKISYESLKATLKKKYKIENYPHPIDEVIKDSFVIELLNRMKYKEVKMFYDNPEWLLEILINYKKSMENDERSSTKSKEEKEKIDEKIIQHESDNSESSLSDKAEVEQKKSNDILDAMKIGKDE